jgi:hypothetical protein
MRQQDRLKTVAVVALFALCLSSPKTVALAEESLPASACPLELFISPYCGLSVARMAEAITRRGELNNAKHPLRFHLIQMTGDISEKKHLQQLVCADQQGALPSMFLYIAHTVHAGRAPHAERFLTEFGIESKKFNDCVKHPSYTQDVLKASSELFWGAGLQGVPSVKFGGTTFTLTTVEHLFGLNQCLSPATD